MSDFYSDVLFPKILNILSKPMVLLLIILFLTALYIILRLLTTHRGILKYGKVISADHTPQGWRKPEHPLFSKTFLLTGYPDYLVQEKDDSLTPVEYKNTPWHGRIYNSHKMQVAAYMLLVEDTLHKKVRHGIIMYGDGTTKKISFTPALRKELLRTMQQMRSLQLPVGWHPDSRRCRSCSLRVKCNMAVVT